MKPTSDDHVKDVIANAKDQVTHGDVIEMTVSSWDDLDREVDEVLMSRLERQPAVDAGRWTRDELYEDE